MTFFENRFHDKMFNFIISVLFHLHTYQTCQSLCLTVNISLICLAVSLTNGFKCHTVRGEIRRRLFSSMSEAKQPKFFFYFWQRPSTSNCCFIGIISTFESVNLSVIECWCLIVFPLALNTAVCVNWGLGGMVKWLLFIHKQNQINCNLPKRIPCFLFKNRDLRFFSLHFCWHSLRHTPIYNW